MMGRLWIDMESFINNFMLPSPYRSTSCLQVPALPLQPVRRIRRHLQYSNRPKWHGPTKAVLATLLRSDFLKWVVPIDRSSCWRIADNRLGSRFRLGIHELNEASVRFQNYKMLTTSFVPTWTCLASSHPGQSLVPCAGPRSTSLRHAYTKTNFLETSSHTLQLKHNRHPSASCTLFHLDLGPSGSTLVVRLA